MPPSNVFLSIAMRHALGKVTVPCKKYFLEIYIHTSSECMRRALHNDASCYKIAFSMLKLYMEVCELRKTD